MENDNTKDKQAGEPSKKIEFVKVVATVLLATILLTPKFTRDAILRRWPDIKR